jgi:hypothetical protein
VLEECVARGEQRIEILRLAPAEDGVDAIFHAREF